MTDEEKRKADAEAMAIGAEIGDHLPHMLGIHDVGLVMPNMGPQVAAAIEAAQIAIEHGPDYIAGKIRAHDQTITDKAKQAHEQQFKESSEELKAMHSKDRLDEGMQYYKDEKTAVAGAMQKEEFQKASFEEQAKMLKAEFDKSTEDQLKFKKDQDARFRATVEDAVVDKELYGLHEQARQELGKWRQSQAQDLCSKEAVLQINNQIDQQVGSYKERLEKRDMEVPLDALLLKEYKVRLEDRMMTPEAIGQKSNELLVKHFGDSLKPPDIAPPTRGDGPGEGDGPGGSSTPNNNDVDKDKYRQVLKQRNGQLSSDEIEKKVQDYGETLEKHDMSAPPNSLMLEERRQELSNGSGPDRNDP